MSRTQAMSFPDSRLIFATSSLSAVSVQKTNDRKRQEIFPAYVGLLQIILGSMTDHSMTPVRQSSGTSSSDLKVVLQHIDIQLCQLRGSIHAVSSQLLAVASAVECIALAQKLQRTLRRWHYYLPFHECADVDFKWWLNYLSLIHKDLHLIGGDKPEASFCIDYLDLYNQEELPCYAPRYEETELNTDVREYVERVNEQIGMIHSLSDEEESDWYSMIDNEAMRIFSKQYTDYLRMLYTGRNGYTAQRFQEQMLPEAKSYLRTITNQPVMAYCLDMALSTLIDNLRQIDDLFSKDLSDSQLLRLSLRLYYRHCSETEQAANHEVHRWAQAWPARRRQERAHEKRQEILTDMRQRFSEPSLDEYIDTEHPSPLTDAEFGRFLFANRHTLSIEEVKKLFHDCFLIRELNHIIDPTGTEAEINAVCLSQERKVIYNRLMELVRKADWKGGMTQERVYHAFAQLLVTHPSDIFWTLLTNRRNCEGEFRSLKITWLNLVGYFRSRGFLKGGSLTLCRMFFPDESLEGKKNESDHNAVNKGAGDRASNNFHDLMKQLDEALGIKNHDTL